MSKGKQIGLRLTDVEVARLDAILERINRSSDTNASNVLREFLGLRPRKVTTEDDFLFFSGRLEFLTKPEQPAGTGAGIIKASTGKRIGRGKPNH